MVCSYKMGKLIHRIALNVQDLLIADMYGNAGNSYQEITFLSRNVFVCNATIDSFVNQGVLTSF